MPTACRVPPPLGPFPVSTGLAGSQTCVPPSPMCISLMTPGMPFNPTPLQSAAIVFEWPQHYGTPMSPMTPLSPANSSTLYQYSPGDRNLSRQSSWAAFAPVVLPQMNFQQAPSIKQTWYQTFDQLFGQFREPWMLRQIDQDADEPKDPGWATEEYWAKVRFICEVSDAAVG